MVTNSEKLSKAGIDLDALLKRLMGNESLIRIFVNKFIADTTFDSLRQAFAQKNMEQAEHASHTLKGMCGNMSLDRLFDLFSKQVQLLRNGECERAEAMMDEISAAYQETVSGMKEWLESI